MLSNITQSSESITQNTDLTPEQQQAISHRDGPMLVVAAAGSGKTMVITRRIACLIANGVPPWSVLALTFTNKAAGEMKERVEALIPPDQGAARGLVVSTFHSFCARLLRRYCDHAGLTKNYSIYDTADQIALMKDVIKNLDLSSTNFKPHALLATISNAKNALNGPESFTKNAGDFWQKQTARCYTAYEQELKNRDAVDFDDLLVLVADLIKNNAEIRQELQQRFRYILVDEYQDTNHAQFTIAHYLAAAHGNICVVGDPDQSIYGWRGADISNILEFQKHYPQARVIKLGKNFRSTSPILTIADHLVKHNVHRHDKPLFTSNPGTDQPEYKLCIDEHHEARVVGEKLADLAADHGIPWKDMAIFYRTNALSRIFESTLRDMTIPYKIIKGTAFYDRKEIKDILAYLRLLINPRDTVSFKRIINTPTRGIGNLTIKKLEVFAGANGINIFDAARRVREIPSLTARSMTMVTTFVKMLDTWRDNGEYMGNEVAGGLAELTTRIIEDIGYEKYLKKSGTDEDLERLENIAELVSSAADFDNEMETAKGIDEFDPFAEDFAVTNTDGQQDQEMHEPTLLDKVRAYLEKVSLVSDSDALDPEAGAVQLMTLHAAKGLEFEVVAMVGMEEGILPHARARDDEMALEEERRLCFVGITRTKRYLLLTSANNRTIRGVSEWTVTSRFISECGAGLKNDDDMQRSFNGDSIALHTHSNRNMNNNYSNKKNESGSGSSSGFEVGTRVVHPQFGIGLVIASLGTGDNSRVKVKFNEVGTKTLVTLYARLKRI